MITLKKEWNALKGGEGPTHVTDYAKTSYNDSNNVIQILNLK